MSNFHNGTANKKLETQFMQGYTGTVKQNIIAAETIQPPAFRDGSMGYNTEDLYEDAADQARIKSHDPERSFIPIEDIPADNEESYEDLSPEEQVEYDKALDAIDNTDEQGIHQEHQVYMKEKARTWKTIPRHQVLAGISKIDPGVQNVYKKEKASWFKKIFKQNVSDKKADKK